MAKQSVVEVKAPKAPKTPDAKKLGGQAQKKAQQRAKKLIKLAIILAIAAVIGLVVYLIMHMGDQPDKVVKELITYAKENNEAGFKNLFTEDSQDMLESAWTDEYSEGSWKNMMKTLTEGDAKVGNRAITEEAGLKFADVEVLLGKDKEEPDVEIIHLRQENERWRVTVNVPIKPTALPELNPPPELIEQFTIVEEDEVEWWKQTSEQVEEEQEKKSGSKLGKKAKSKIKIKKPKFKLPKGVKLPK